MYSAFCCYCCVIGHRDPASFAWILLAPSSTCTLEYSRKYSRVRLVVVVCVGASSYVLRPLLATLMHNTLVCILVEYLFINTLS